MMKAPSSWRWAFPLDELRTGGLIQASLIALGLGWRFRHAPPGTPTHWWAYALFTYAVMASVMPWSIASFYEDESDAASILLRTVFFALPMAVAARWLAPTPYRLIGLGCWGLVGLWGVYVVILVALRLRRRAI